MAETAQKNKAPVVVQKESTTVTSRGAGPTGTTASVVVSVVKDQVLPTVTAVVPVATRNGGYTAPAATAGSFDRTVATSLGK
jgi:hypothetical protein